jgi:hypothetical protein
MGARRSLAIFIAASAAALGIDGCSNLLGIDGEYGEQIPLGDSGVQPPKDAPPADTRDVVVNDITVEDRMDSGGGSDVVDVIVDQVSDVRVPCETPTGACVGALPADWELILFASDRATACPINFTGTDLISGPMAGAGACDCSCTVNSGATCTQGMMATKYGDDNTCPTVGLTLNVPDGMCQPINSNIRGWYSSTLAAGDRKVHRLPGDQQLERDLHADAPVQRAVQLSRRDLQRRGARGLLGLHRQKRRSRLPFGLGHQDGRRHRRESDVQRVYLSGQRDLHQRQDHLL